MADTKLSAIATEQSTLTNTDRVYLVDGTTSKYATAQTLRTLTGDVTCGVDGVTSIAAAAVGTTEIDTSAVTEPKIASNSVTNAKMADNSVDTAEIVDAAVTTVKVDDAAITSAKIASDAVTGAKRSRNVNAQIGTTYTLATADINAIVTCNNGSTITVTVPASVFAAGDTVDVIQLGAGQVQFSAGAGFTLSKPATLNANIAEQYAGATVVFTSATTGVLVGNLEVI